MMAAERRSGWSEGLPVPRGRMEANAPIARYTWFRTGGPAELLFEPADEEDLCAVLAALDESVPVTVIGVGSNLLVRDGGVDGLIVRLGKAFGAIRAEGHRLIAGAGATDIAVSHAARDAGLAGLEFLRGVPGTVGGAVKMNAGAYGREMADVLAAARAVDRTGASHSLKQADLGFTYRHSTLPEGWIVTEATLAGRLDRPEAIAARMDAITRAREESQPLRTRTGGSTFKNPAGDKAWRLVDQAGCRGLKIGGAMVSDKHTNFLINAGEATSAELEALGEEVRRRVKRETGVTLEWEIQRIGQPAEKAR